MLILEILVLCLIMFAICYANTGTDAKNIRSFHAYPDEVQEYVLRDPELKGLVVQTSSLVTFGKDLLIFGVIILAAGFSVREPSFTSNFLKLLILGQCVNVFDLVFIDLIWWRNSRRPRFMGTKEMAEMYSDPGKHIMSFIKAVILFTIIAAVDGWILTLF